MIDGGYKDLIRFLNFVVHRQTISCDPQCDFTGIASGSRGYLHARFSFSADWGGCKVVAVFHSRGKEYPVSLKGNSCLIPHEALTGNVVGVCLIGQKDNHRITTNKVTFTQVSGV